MRRRTAGTTLLEVMIAFTVSAVALGLAAQLFLEAQRRTAYEARRLTEPAVSLALQQLRADVLAATSVTGGDLLGLREPLILRGLDDHYVRYTLADDVLQRAVYEPDRAAWTDERALLHGVTIWRWQVVLSPDPALAVEIGYLEASPFTARIAGGQRERLTPIERRRSLLLTPRGNGGRSW